MKTRAYIYITFYKINKVPKVKSRLAGEVRSFSSDLVTLQLKSVVNSRLLYIYIYIYISSIVSCLVLVGGGGGGGGPNPPYKKFYL